MGKKQAKIKEILNKAFFACSKKNYKRAIKLYESIIPVSKLDKLLEKKLRASDDKSDAAYNYGSLYFNQLNKDEKIDEKIKNYQTIVKLFKLSINYADKSKSEWRKSIWPIKEYILICLYEQYKLYKDNNKNDKTVEVLRVILEEYKSLFIEVDGKSLIVEQPSEKAKIIFEDLNIYIMNICNCADKSLEANYQEAELHYNLALEYIEFLLNEFSKNIAEQDKSKLKRIKVDINFNLAANNDLQEYTKAKNYADASLRLMDELISGTEDVEQKREYEDERKSIKNLLSKISDNLIKQKMNVAALLAPQEFELAPQEFKLIPYIIELNAEVSSDKHLEKDYEKMGSDEIKELSNQKNMQLEEFAKQEIEVKKREAIAFLFEKFKCLAVIQEEINGYYKWTLKVPHPLLQQEDLVNEENFKKKYEKISVEDINNKLIEVENAINKAEEQKKKLAEEKRKNIQESEKNKAQYQSVRSKHENVENLRGNVKRIKTGSANLPRPNL